MKFYETKLYNDVLKDVSNLNQIWFFKTNTKQLIAINNDYDSDIILVIDFIFKDFIPYLVVYQPIKEVKYCLDYNFNKSDYKLLTSLIYNDDFNPIQEIVLFILFINQKHKFSKENKDKNLDIINNLNWFNK